VASKSNNKSNANKKQQQRAPTKSNNEEQQQRAKTKSNNEE
jgi:hypothetical protein